jgi:hypothetical protein
LAFVLALVFDAVLEDFAVMDGFLIFGTGRLKRENRRGINPSGVMCVGFKLYRIYRF